MKKNSLKLIVLSFFKENEINYFYDKETLTFNCYACGNEAIMNASTSIWECQSCKKQGNLKDLVDNKKQFKKDMVLYNPRKEKNELLKKLRLLISKQTDEIFIKQLEHVYDQTHQLTNYLLNEKESLIE